MHVPVPTPSAFAVFEDARAGLQPHTDTLNDILAHRTTAEPLSLDFRARERPDFTRSTIMARSDSENADHLTYRLTGWRADVDTLDADAALTNLRSGLKNPLAVKTDIRTLLFASAKNSRRWEPA